MADYYQQVEQLQNADAICMRHVITTPVNGIQPEYPRWPAAFAECEKVHRWFLETKTIRGVDDLDDRSTIMKIVRNLPR